MFTITQVNWPWQGQEELVLKPDANEKKAGVIEVRILIKDSKGEAKIGDKIDLEIKSPLEAPKP